MPRARIVAVAIVAFVSSAGCSSSGIAFEYRDSDDYAFSKMDRNAIETIATTAARDVRCFLPELPPELRITIQTGSRVIPETGETGSIGLPRAIYWTVNPAHPGGVVSVARAQLRATLFHECYHLVREATLTPDSLVDLAVNEGLATAFERDHGGAATPWGDYDDNIAVWTEELLALPADAPQRDWMFSHPDGRRWIGFKVGTYLADRAAKASGLSLSQLATVPTAQILAWARRPESH